MDPVTGSLLGFSTGGGGLTLGDLGGSATSSATTGAVRLGDKIAGSTSNQYKIIKLLVVFAGAVVLYKLWRK